MSAPLTAAHTLARQIARQRIQHEDRCTWIGPMVDAEGAVVEGTLGADLYSGLPGIALVLGEVARATDDPELRAAAAAAIRQAAAVAGRHHAPPGLFVGTTGIALVAVRLGRRGHDASLVELGRTLPNALAPGERFDLIDGVAGTAIGERCLQRLLGEVSPDRDAALSGRLRGLASDEDAGLSWRPSGADWPHGLTGLAHGASGSALALAELGDGDAAHRAIRYESRWFDARARNWRDLRAPILSFATAWCHGAPGMVLARRRIRELTGEPAGPQEIAGLATTRRHLEACLAGVGANLCLCHGLCGLAEIVDICHPGTDAVPRTVDVILEHLEYGIPLPCGIPGGHSLGLMTGVAGILHFLLRAADPTVPSVLLMRPEDWAASG